MERFNALAHRPFLLLWSGQTLSRLGDSLRQLALAWCYSRWFIASTIIGATSLVQLRENIDALAVRLSPQVVAAVDAIHAKLQNPGQ